MEEWTQKPMFASSKYGGLHGVILCSPIGSLNLELNTIIQKCSEGSALSTQEWRTFDGLHMCPCTAAILTPELLQQIQAEFSALLYLPSRKNSCHGNVCVRSLSFHVCSFTRRLASLEMKPSYQWLWGPRCSVKSSHTDVSSPEARLYFLRSHASKNACYRCAKEYKSAPQIPQQCPWNQNGL